MIKSVVGNSYGIYSEFCKLLCQHVPVIWTDIEPESIRHWTFLSVLQTGPKDFKNSALLQVWLAEKYPT